MRPRTRDALPARCWLILSGLLLGLGCTLSPLDIKAKACPCAAGWTCDERLDQCVQGIGPKDALDASALLDGGKPSHRDAGVIDREDAGSPDPADGNSPGTNDAGSMVTADARPMDLPCDGAPMSPWWRDTDGDGFGDRAQAVQSCTAPPNHVANSDDCDDGERTSYPRATELCDTLDNDCDVASGDACPSACTPRTFDRRLYWLCNGALSWRDASLACASGGLTLVRIDSTLEQDFVHAGAVELIAGAQVWLGASDLAEPGVWRWSDGTEFWRGTASGSASNGAYTKWGVSEPSAGTAEHCAEMRAASMWNDANCDALRGFVCERP